MEQEETAYEKFYEDFGNLLIKRTQKNFSDEKQMTIRKKNGNKKLEKEDYRFLADFLQAFSNDSKEFFDLIIEKFGEDHPCSKFAAIAINHMQYLKIPIQDQCEIDVGYQEADEIFRDIENFMTDGYYRGSFK